MSWDPIAAAHLRRLVMRIDAAGVTESLRIAVQELWLADIERHDPDALFDDDSTLGYTASRNVTNRLLAELRGPQGSRQPLAHAVRDNQSTVIRVGAIDVRIVKAAVRRSLDPRFSIDFRWESREGRLEPATRNAERYNAPLARGDIDPLFEIPMPTASERVAACTDVFAVWGGDALGRTAGWFGLPTTAPGSWLAVQSAWRDDDLGGAGDASSREPKGPRNPADQGEPDVRITLRPRPGLAGRE